MSIVVTDRCHRMEEQLGVWKSTLQGLLRRLETLREVDRERLHPSVRDINACIAEMTARIEQLRADCPAGWADSLEEDERATIDMRGRYEETVEAIGRHAPVSIPG